MQVLALRATLETLETTIEAAIEAALEAELKAMFLVEQQAKLQVQLGYAL